MYMSFFPDLLDDIVIRVYKVVKCHQWKVFGHSCDSKAQLL